MSPLPFRGTPISAGVDQHLQEYVTDIQKTTNYTNLTRLGKVRIKDGQYLAPLRVMWPSTVWEEDLGGWFLDKDSSCRGYLGGVWLWCTFFLAVMLFWEVERKRNVFLQDFEKAGHIWILIGVLIDLCPR